MEDLVQRLTLEKNELDEKISKLTQFQASENFAKIEAIQQSLLNAQYFAMASYSQILTERIDWLTK